ncbi:hypothetical protein L1987_35547 [Smallanthus sonchifolius]|uniref:Uncharacterized protein n=1 Tax=Smallanthus sonchifolius TaxID=185202 RepID=A0ACB9HY40_9ASTR|nr:hypothetical protein L1987_35547 [Smallanthus sonchifolius]
MASSSPERKKNVCRRFSDEQIKSLESLFKTEKRLEPRKKVEMARELGLHPRQVAIWFQNRRARWKSKQVEQDYTNLKADYHTLTHRLESLNKEKHDLLQQLSNLCSQLKHKDLDSGNSSCPLAIHDDSDPNHKQNMAMAIEENVTNFDSGDEPWWDIWS